MSLYRQRYDNKMGIRVMKTYTNLMKRYSAIYRKNPGSKVFALLADLYRKRGDMEKALVLCRKGLRKHPEFALGHIALGLVFFDMEKWEMAVSSLEKAVDLSPENIFAYKMLGRAWLKLKNPEKTLQAYKMVLFLDPGNEKVESLIKKLEPMTAVQYDKTGFAFKTLKEVARCITPSPSNDPNKPFLHPIQKPGSRQEKERFSARSSMVSALIYRKEFEKAGRFLMEMKNIYAQDKTCMDQIKQLENKLPGEERDETELFVSPFSSSVNKKSQERQKKIQRLKHILTRVEQIKLTTGKQL